MKNVHKEVLLSVPMHGLRHDLKTYVITQNPKTMEHFRQIAILAEKAQPSQVSTIETYENLLQEIQQIKAKIESQAEQPLDSHNTIIDRKCKIHILVFKARDRDINTRNVGITGLSLWVNRRCFSRPRV